MHMLIEPPVQALSLVEKLEARRVEVGASQAAWAGRLGVSQGHYSKLVNRKAAPGRGLAARVRHLVDQPNRSEFEASLLEAARTFPRFESLLRLLLDMHSNALAAELATRPAQDRP